jgi:hypothetical protein
MFEEYEENNISKIVHPRTHMTDGFFNETRRLYIQDEYVSVMIKGVPDGISPYVDKYDRLSVDRIYRLYYFASVPLDEESMAL